MATTLEEARRILSLPEPESPYPSEVMMWRFARALIAASEDLRRMRELLVETDEASRREDECVFCLHPIRTCRDSACLGQRIRAAITIAKPRYRLLAQLDDRWRPAFSGILNETGKTDEEASTFDSREEAEYMARNLICPMIAPQDWRIEETT